MAAVIGFPREDEPGNEYAKAFVVLKPGATATLQRLLEWAKTRMA